jgi:hypothetical protein
VSVLRRIILAAEDRGHTVQAVHRATAEMTAARDPREGGSSS